MPRQQVSEPHCTNANLDDLNRARGTGGGTKTDELSEKFQSETKCVVDSIPIEVPFDFSFVFQGMSNRQFDSVR